MAKQKSVIKIQGSIDDMTFYQMNGKNFVKKKNEGITKEKLNNDPRFKRTKENTQEFAGATASAAGIRMGFISVPNMLDNTFSLRLLSLCREVINKSEGPRGQRSFRPDFYKETFLNLSLNKNALLHTVFRAPYTISVPADRNSAGLDVPSFNPANFVDAPQGATHFRILFQVSAVSPYEYALESKKYEPTFPDESGKHTLVSSDYFLLTESTVSIPPLEAALPDVTLLPDKVVLLVCVGIEFYQLIGTTHYRLAAGDAMKVAAVK